VNGYWTKDAASSAGTGQSARLSDDLERRLAAGRERAGELNGRGGWRPFLAVTFGGRRHTAAATGWLTGAPGGAALRADEFVLVSVRSCVRGQPGQLRGPSG